MRTLHIHIGTPKTATTAIQNFCKENAGLLEQKGYCYTIFPIVYPRVARTRNGHFLLGKIEDADGVRDFSQEEKNFKEGMQMVQELFLRHDHVILSDESIWRGMDSERKTLWSDLMEEAKKGGFRLHAIVYLRRQDKFFASLWNQQVKKMTETETFAQFSDSVNREIRIDYYAKLERMAAVIGKENITVRRFDGGKFEGGSIYSDFLLTIGLTLTDEYEISQGIRNTGLYGNTHEIKRILNSLPQMKDPHVRNFIREALQECSDYSSRAYPAEMFSKEETEAFLKTYEEGNRKIAQEYLNEPGADLFDNTIKDVPKWEKDNPFMMDDLIRFAGIALMRLYEEKQILQEEVKSILQKEARPTIWNRLRHPILSFQKLVNKILRRGKQK